MKLLMVTCALLATASAQFGQQQLNKPAPIPILAYSNEISHDGTYAYSYQSADGSAAQESGYLENPGHPELEAMVSQGSYSYTAPDGTPITVTYIADKNGFRAEGAHLPTPPPIPEAIARSLEFIARAQGRAGPTGGASGGSFNQQNRNTFG